MCHTCVPQYKKGERIINEEDETLQLFGEQFGEAAEVVLAEALLEREIYNPSASVPTMVRE